MPTHAEKRYLPYKPEQMFDLVAGVNKYPQFLPWCKAARITKREGNVFYADLIIAFKVFRESFTSKVELVPDQRPREVRVEYIDGPFKYLNNTWRFVPAEDGGTIVDFNVDFEFRSAVLQKMIGVLFNEAVRRMVAAFETRADKIYEPVSQRESQRLDPGQAQALAAT